MVTGEPQRPEGFLGRSSCPSQGCCLRSPFWVTLNSGWLLHIKVAGAEGFWHPSLLLSPDLRVLLSPFFSIRESVLYRSSCPSQFSDDKKKYESYLVNISSAPTCIKSSVCIITFQLYNHLKTFYYYSPISQIRDLRFREVKGHA